MTHTKLGDVADVKISGVDKKTQPGEDTVRLCNYTDIYYNWAITKEMYGGLMVASAKASEINDYSVGKGMVVITKDSETREDIGHSAYVADDFCDVVLGYHCAFVKPHKGELDGSFLNGLLRSSYAAKYFANNAGGSGQRYYLNEDAIKGLPLFLPSFKEQCMIGKFLSSVDRKIALNRKKIEKLEALAKTIYDYWFVQFDFPDANGRPYKSSGGKMVYNPILKREIPAGWEVVRLDSIADVYNGATPSTEEASYYDGSIVWVTPKDLSDQQRKFTCHGGRCISKAGYDSCSTHMLPPGAILMTSRAPIGLMSIAAVPLCTNQGFKSIVAHEMSDAFYLYYYLHSHMPQIKLLGSGTTFKEVSRESMCSFPVIYPANSRINKDWTCNAMSIFESQKGLLSELDCLISLRDFLLPLLMNGQVEVGE